MNRRKFKNKSSKALSTGCLLMILFVIYITGCSVATSEPETSEPEIIGITRISLPNGPSDLSVRLYDSIKTIELIYDATVSGTVDINVELSPGATLSIDGEIVDDPSMISYTLSLTVTQTFETRWVVTAPDNTTTNYTIRESRTPTRYTQVVVTSPIEINVTIEDNKLSVEYNSQISAATAVMQLKSETEPPLYSEFFTIDLDKTNPGIKSTYDLPITTIGGTYTEVFTLGVTYNP